MVSSRKKRGFDGLVEAVAKKHGRTAEQVLQDMKSHEKAMREIAWQKWEREHPDAVERYLGGVS